MWRLGSRLVIILVVWRREERLACVGFAEREFEFIYLGGDGRRDRTPMDNFRGFRAQNQHVIDTMMSTAASARLPMADVIVGIPTMVRHFISDRRRCIPYRQLLRLFSLERLAGYADICSLADQQ